MSTNNSKINEFKQALNSKEYALLYGESKKIFPYAYATNAGLEEFYSDNRYFARDMLHDELKKDIVDVEKVSKIKESTIELVQHYQAIDNGFEVEKSEKLNRFIEEINSYQKRKEIEPIEAELNLKPEITKEQSQKKSKGIGLSHGI